MSSSLYSLGRWAFGARRLVLTVWVLLLVLAGGSALLLSKGLDNTVSVPGTESQQAIDRLGVTFPQVSGASGQILVVAPKGGDVRSEAIRKPVTEAVDQLRDAGQVAQVVSPYDERIGGTVSEDRSAALIAVQMDTQATTVSQASKDGIVAVSDRLAERLPEGAQSTHGGQLFSQELPELSVVEGVGVIVALVVLVATLGSFLAAGMPLVTALIGVGISSALILLATSWTSVMATAPLLALMLGLAVGIDYALFVISRYQQELAGGVRHRDAAARSVATAGSAVIFAGVTVIIALIGLAVAGIPFLTTMGIAAAVAVCIAVLISITLLPALLGFAGGRVRPRAHRKGKQRRKANTRGDRFFLGWVRAITRFPVLTIVAVVVVLGLAAAPATGLRLALPDAGALPEGDPARVTYDRVSEHLGPGFNGPLLVTGSIVTSNDPLKLMKDLKGEIERFDGVAAVPLSTPNRTADTGIIQVIPEGGPDSEQTKALVQKIRSAHDYLQGRYGVDLSVTGFTAIGIDISDKLGAALLPFAIVIVGLSLLLLTMVFRSIAVPVKAALGYLLSIGASLGIVTLVFQHGYLGDLLNLARAGPVISFMPIVLMGVLFGLAMDYEVFLASRMREYYAHTRDARRSVETGFVSSAKVVTAAALIMFAVFVGFVPEGDTNIKPIALGLAVGVLVDAFVVRMTLVPAVLALLGDKAWWIPERLGRALPSFDIEGENLTRELELAEWPSPDANEAVICEGLTLPGSSQGDPIYRDVSFTFHCGGTYVVRGGQETSVTALLLTISGRLKPGAGKLKVCGYVLPGRSGAVRSRVAYVDLGSPDPDPLTAIRQALREQPEVLVLDRTDRVPDPGRRDAVRELLASGREQAERPLTVVAGSAGVADARELLPPYPPVSPVEVDADRAAVSEDGLLFGSRR